MKKKKHNEAAKESIKISRVTKLKLNEAELNVYFGRLHTAQFCKNLFDRFLSKHLIFLNGDKQYSVLGKSSRKGKRLKG